MIPRHDISKLDPANIPIRLFLFIVILYHGFAAFGMFATGSWYIILGILHLTIALSAAITVTIIEADLSKSILKGIVIVKWLCLAASLTSLLTAGIQPALINLVFFFVLWYTERSRY